MAPTFKRRKAPSTNVEEIRFDPEARQEYLSGFHKRKLQRIKHAQALAAKKQRAEKIEQRRKKREERKEEARKHVANVNSLIREARAGNALKDTSETEEGLDGAEGWEGFDESTADELINHENEYVDEDLYTTVTVDVVEVSRDGLHVTAEIPADESKDEKVNEVEVAGTQELERLGTDHKRAGKRVWTKERPVTRKKRNTFRYENKAERKVTRTKERVAKTRKGRNKE